MRRVISLPALNKLVTIGNYVKGIKLAKANPDMEFRHGLTCWWSCTGRDIMRQFREGMMQRISDAIPYNLRGVKND